MHSSTANCSLCATKTKKPLFDPLEQHLPFCCSGCQTVYRILMAKGSLDNYQQDPLFKQAVHSGLISNPALLEQIALQQKAAPNDPRERLHLEVTEMWCPACAEVIRLILLQEKGISSCQVDYSTDLASIEFSPRYLSKEKILALINGLGYQARLLEDPAKRAVSSALTLRFIVAAFCSFNTMMFAYPIYASAFDSDLTGYAHLFSWLSLAASLPVITFSGYPIFRRCFHSLRVGLFGMETLVTVGVAAAFSLSLYHLLNGSDQIYFDSMTLTITLVLLGKIIESKAKFSAKETLLRLNRALPKRGRRLLEDGTTQFVLLKEVQKGEKLMALAGEKVVLDGIVIKGEGFCDEALMTGESRPVAKREGSLLLAGSLVKQGSFTFKVTSSLEETALHKIIDTLGHFGKKALYIRSVDRIVRWFVPAVLAIALATFLVGWAFGAPDPLLRAISVLLISCPCAIGIAAPLAESTLMNQLAALGVIVRNRGCLALLGDERRKTLFVFDKTGTVTEGTFALLSGLEQLTAPERAILKGLAMQSLHPISQSIARAVAELPFPLDTFQEEIGRGISCHLGEDRYLLGSAAYTGQPSPAVSDQIVTTVYFTKNGALLTPLVLGDRVRSQITELITQLPNPLLLSGDSEAAVAAVANSCGFKAWRAECSPFDKRQLIEKLREEGQLVCMVGDGINDSLALAQADIGISVMSATDISIQVSDLLLTTDRLQIIPKIRSLASKGSRIAQQNLFWAFFYNAIGIPLAVMGLLSPLFAAVAMMLSSLFVLFNTKRID